MNKFRAWDSFNNKMYYPNGNGYFYDEFSHDHFVIDGLGQPIFLTDMSTPEGIVLMRSVGITDKNNKELYEDDIINGAYIGGIVKFFPEYGIFGTVDKRAPNSTKPKGRGGSSTTYEPYNFKPYYHNRIEIIGNIHENSDLLCI